WTLRLVDGALVHLPADGTAAALAWLESRAATGLLDADLESIDLRVAGQLVVRRPDQGARQRMASGLAGGDRRTARPHAQEAANAPLIVREHRRGSRRRHAQDLLPHCCPGAAAP